MVPGAGPLRQGRGRQVPVGRLQPHRRPGDHHEIAATDPMNEEKGGRYLTQIWHPGAVGTAIGFRERFRTFETELLVCCRSIDPRVRTVGPGTERLACPTVKR